MIEFKNVSKTYQTRAGMVPALKDVSLTVKRGEIFGVIGQSGAGKSTLIRCVNLLERPDRGQILIDGTDVCALANKSLRDVRHGIGMIFQHFNLLASRNVYENIALPLELLKYPAHKIHETIMPLLALTNLEEKKHAFPRELSGGQKQRVAIARALASNPSILLCDEATSALDFNTTRSILDLLKNINKTLGITILLITHEMDVVKAICDRVALISAGEILECSAMESFFSKPQTEKARHLINSLMHRELPEKINKTMSAVHQVGLSEVWRMYFTGGNAQIPLISRAIQNFSIEVNIFQANIETLKEDTLGIMDVTVSGDKQKLADVTQFLLAHGVRIEVLGYV